MVDIEDKTGNLFPLFSSILSFHLTILSLTNCLNKSGIRLFTNKRISKKLTNISDPFP